MENACKHDHMHFENGGLHLVCDNCKYVYAAVGHCPLRIIQDYKARGMGLSEMHKRSDPFAVKPIAKFVKSTKNTKKPAAKRPSEILLASLAEGIAREAKREPQAPPRTGRITVKPKIKKSS